MCSSAEESSWPCVGVYEFEDMSEPRKSFSVKRSLERHDISHVITPMQDSLLLMRFERLDEPERYQCVLVDKSSC